MNFTKSIGRTLIQLFYSVATVNIRRTTSGMKEHIVLKFYINIDVKRWVPESYTHSFTARSEGVTKVYRKKWRKWMVISAIVFTPTLFFSYLSIQFLTSYESFHKFYTIDGFLLHMFWLMPIFFTLMSGVVYMVLTLAIKAILYPQNLKTEI